MIAGWEHAAPSGAVGVVRCRSLDGVEGLVHGFATRRGPLGDGDFGPPGGGSAAERELRKRFAAAIGAPEARLAEVRQVHGTAIVAAAGASLGVEADAIVVRASQAGLLAAVRTADCVPVILAGPVAAAAVHAGWRGIAAGMCRRAVESLREAGQEPEALIAAIGPAIGPCCYPVGESCARAVERSAPGEDRPSWRIGSEGVHVDLSEACRRQLVHAGVRPGRVHRAPWCTACRLDLFPSFRRDGERAGRVLSAVGFTALAGPRA